MAQHFRNSTTKLGFVYRWTDSSNGMYYVGSHCGSVDDGYIGSGKHFKYAYKKRPESFDREILYVGEDFLELEDLILKTLDSSNDEKSYNMINCAVISHKDKKRSEDTRKKQSEVRIGMKFSDQHRANISKALIGGCRRKQAIRDTQTGIEYKTIKECCDTLGLNKNSVNHAFWRYRKGLNKSSLIKHLEYV
jgi:hypothetical protein